LRRIFSSFPSILIAFLVLTAPLANAADKVVLQLKWTHAYQFAGYYAAKELGYYDIAGLDVKIKPLSPGEDALQEVVSGRANYGSGTSGILVARQEGAPVVALAAIYQHSPYVLIAKKSPGSEDIHSLDGKPILLRRLSDELLVYLRRQNITLSKVASSVPGMDTVEQLTSGKAAAISGYISNEPYQLAAAGIPAQIYSPRSIGIDIYGDNLFTTSEEINKHPERTERFRLASLQGWEYVLNHPDEAVALVQKYAPQESAAKIQFERDKLQPLIRSDLVPVGFMNEARWQHTVEIFQEAGGLKSDFSLKGFVYNANPKQDLAWIYGALFIAVATLLAVSTVVYYIWRLNKRLTVSLTQVQHLAYHDNLTGLPNRNLFVDRLQRAILKARREKSVLALLFIDIDRFKSINDQFGHSAGDEVLKACCNRMMACIRDSDSLGRIGGDEFVLLLEDLHSSQDALEIAKKIKSAIEIGVTVSGELIHTTASIGIALYPSDSDSEEGLFKRADSAMYKSKQSGRNAIYLYSDVVAQEKI